MADKKISELTETTTVEDTDLLTTVQEGVNKKITGANAKEQFGLDRFIAMGEPNGIVDKTQSTIFFVNATRTFTINPLATDFDYYIRATKYTSTGDSKTITDVIGLHLLYYDGTTLSEIANPSNIQVRDITLHKCMVAYIYWTGTMGKLLEERHGITLDSATHALWHFSLGAQYQDGLALGDFLVDQDGSLDSHAQFSTASGTINDEDLNLPILAIGSTVGLEIWYLDGSNWKWTTNSGFSVLTTGSGRLAFNDSGTQTEVNNNGFVLCHVVGWNADDQKPIAIQGQNQYGNITAARQGAEAEFANLKLIGLPSPEMKPIGTVIFQTADTYTNAVKGRVRSTDTGQDYVDFRRNPLNATVTASDHGQLAGLADDDHVQYLNINGRSGGQTAYGGTAASEDLILGSTSNATKGVVRSMDDFSIDTGKAYQFNKVDFMTTPGTNNVCIGFNTNGSITTGQDNVFIGTEAGNQTTTGSQNVYIGYQSGKDGITAQFNLAIGYQAGSSLTNASNNVFIGNSAGRTITSGGYNVLIGASAGTQTTTATNNICIGYQAGRINNANQNTYIGYQAGKDMLTGADNVFIGNQAGLVGTTIASTILIGCGSGVALTTGTNNVLLGKDAGASLTTEAGNIFIGYQAGQNATVSNKLYIENSNTATPLIEGDFSTNALKINGTLEVTGKLTVGGAIDPTGLILDAQASAPSTDDGTIYYDSAATEFKFRENGEWRTLEATGLWQRTDTTLSPVNSGDSVDLGEAGLTANILKVYGTFNPVIRIAEGGSTTNYTYLADAGENLSLIRKVRATAGDCSLRIDSMPASTSNAYIDLFRNTNTSGNVSLDLYKGDGTTTKTIGLDAVNGNVYLYGAANPTLTISEGGSTAKYTMLQDTAVNQALFRKVRDDAGDCIIDIDCIGSETSNSSVRFFRYTTKTTGLATVGIGKADGTTTQTITLFGKTGRINAKEIAINWTGAMDGLLYVNQNSNTAAIPGMTINQQDVSEGFINFMGTAQGSIATSTTDSEGSLRIEVNGTVKRIPYYADA